MRQGIEEVFKTGKISSAQKEVILKAMHKNPKKFHLKLKQFMNLKENDYLQARKEAKKKELVKVEKMLADAKQFIEDAKKKADRIDDINKNYMEASIN